MTLEISAAEGHVSHYAEQQLAEMRASVTAGAYDALPVRPGDGAPDGAVVTVFHECGGLAGYASETVAYGPGGQAGGACAASLADAVSRVAHRDRCRCARDAAVVAAYAACWEANGWNDGA